MKKLYSWAVKLFIVSTSKEMKHFWDRRIVRFLLLGIIPLAILCTPLLAYLGTFAKYGYSRNNQDWANFSTFLNSFVLLSNVYLFFLLTLSIDRYSRRRNHEIDEFQRGLARPILIFKTVEKVANGNNPKEIWVIENVGNGPALKLKIGEWKEGQWGDKVVKGYSLGQSQDISLDWLEKGALLCVTYEDTFKKKYVTISVGDESYPMPKEEWEDFELVHSHNFIRDDLDRFDNLTAMRLYKARNRSGLSSTTGGPATSPLG